ncbi:MAG: hypothetical protein AB7G13_12970 [Lautropia sp.]
MFTIRRCSGLLRWLPARLLSGRALTAGGAVAAWPGRTAAGGGDPFDGLAAALDCGVRAEHVARVAADRIFVLEGVQHGVAELAALARRELRGGTVAAVIDSLALVSIAMQQALGLRPHLPQLTATALLLSGRAVEVPAGEGRSLALALAAAVRALGGGCVHLVMRDDGAAGADATRLGPFFAALGIRTALLTADHDDRSGGQGDAAEVLFAAPAALIRDALRTADPVRAADPTRAVAALDVAEPVTCGSIRPALPESACALLDDLDATLIDGALTRFAVGHRETTVQAFFRRYRRLGGVSTTLAEACDELARVYRLDVHHVASIYPDFRRSAGLATVDDDEALLARVRDRALALRAVRRPVLIVADDEAICAAAVAASGVPVTIRTPAAVADALAGRAALQARQAALARDGGRAGAITVCSDRASRDVDIMLDPMARAAGGLAVIVVGLPATRRAERRLAQLCARQGHPGTIEILVGGAGEGRLAGGEHGGPDGGSGNGPADSGPGGGRRTATLPWWRLPSPLPGWLLQVRRRFAERRAELRRRRHARQPATVAARNAHGSSWPAVHVPPISLHRPAAPAITRGPALPALAGSRMP